MLDGGDEDPWGPSGAVFSESSEGEDCSDSDDDSSLSSERIAELRRLDDESDAEHGFSSDEEEDDVIIRTGDEEIPIPTSVLIEHRRRFVYSPETLMRLIPNDPSFDKVREDLRIQKTEFKFSLTESNKSFERNYFRKYGKTPDRTSKKFKIVYRGDDLDRFFGHKHPFSKKGLYRPVRPAPYKRRTPPKVERVVPEPQQHVLLHPATRAILPKAKQITKICVFADKHKHFLVQELGGVSYMLPKAAVVDSMMWYRFRKGQPYFSNTFGVIRANALKHGNTSVYAPSGD